MEERIAQELELLRKHWPDLEYVEEGRWVRLPRYSLPKGWNRSETDVAFQILPGYPGTPPYGFYVPVGLTFAESLDGLAWIDDPGIQRVTRRIAGIKVRITP